MKQSLQLKLGQSLTMTPQLQQAIRLLQLSSLDLQAEIEEALESNPMLERNEESESNNNNESNDTNDLGENDTHATAEVDNSTKDTGEMLDSENLSNDLPVDTQWDDLYSNSPVSLSRNDAPQQDYEYSGNITETLQEHLLWQMQLTPFTDLDEAIATTIIDSIDQRGYLTACLEDIRLGLGFTDQDEEVELDEIQAVLKRVQAFDPVGVAARNLSECLTIQLKQFHKDSQYCQTAIAIVNEHINDLANKNYRGIQKGLKISETSLKHALTLIHTLNPSPGEMIDSIPAQYVVPDVMVSKKKGRWVVELNPDTAPRLRINNSYASLIRRADNSSDNTFMRNHLQEAKWFLKSLHSRNETLLKVASRIVTEQQAFLEYGDEAMKPMVLQDIAEAVGMHESTISRVTTQKYMHTPRGIYELKYFFSSHVSTANGGECSSTAIRALIKKLIAAELPQKPLSDNKIANLLKDQGINVARRTIAKYREAMAIPPSNERKSII